MSKAQLFYSRDIRNAKLALQSWRLKEGDPITNKIFFSLSI